MGFKVTKKDLLLFCLYCILLLYFCAIAVLNFASFSNDGTFYGLLPFKAFSFEYIGYTLALFVAVLILIFSSVSSYIFNKDKGSFGIHIGDKGSDGYSKWASEKDIKTDKNIVRVVPSDKTLEAAGIPLINKGNEIWVDNGEYHNLVIGATGSGKTECVVKPLVNLLSKKGESMVITDPKGEIYEYCGEYLRSQGYRIIILNFREPEKGNAWNPLSLPYQYYKAGNTDKGIELLDDVALNILYNKDGGKDSEFWEKSAADYFSGLALGLFMDAKEKEVNLNSINIMSTVGDERRGTTPYIKEYFHLKGESSAPYIFASNTINAPNDTKGGILSTFRQKIRLFSTRESLSEMLSYSDFDMRDIGKQKTAVFMIIHDEKKTYHGLMTIFVKQCYETLIDCAQKNGGKLEYRTNFILDEFPNMPPLKDVDSMVTAARSRDIRFTFIIQNFAQLNDVYGEEVAQVIKGNCGNLIYLISTELKALEEISKMCGEVKSKKDDKTASTPLITVSDLQKLKLFQAIIIRWRKNPFKTQLTPDFKIDWGTNYGKATLPTREKEPIEIFDIKAFVNEQMKDQALNNPGMKAPGANPFLQPGYNPFMQNTPPRNPFASDPSKPTSSNPFLNSTPSSNPTNPFMGSNPALNANNPFMNNNSTPMMNNPFVNNQPSQTPSVPTPASNNTLNTNPFANNGFNPYANLTNKDIDDMVKNIEKKLAQLDAEEAAEKAKQEQEKTKITDVESKLELPKTTEPEIKTIFEPEVKDEDLTFAQSEVKKETAKDDALDLTQEIKLDDISKPKINVDKDSVIVNDNVVTDDEFYDDFFDDE